MGTVNYLVAPSGEQWAVAKDGEVSMTYVTKLAAYEVAVSEAAGDMRYGHEVVIRVEGSGRDEQPPPRPVSPQ